MGFLVTPSLKRNLQFGFLSHPIKCIVFIHDPEDQVELNKTTLLDMYGITMAEASVAIHLTAGRSPEEIAVFSDKSINTIRTQVKSLMRKTQTSRQSELVSVLLTGLARV